MWRDHSLRTQPLTAARTAVTVAPMRIWSTIAAVLLASVATSAQWLNYPTPGLPRTRDGKPNLTAPMPTTPDGRPDLSGVWHVQPDSRAEMKRLFGDDADAVEVPGMEIDTISKYGVNILIDFKPGEEPIRKDVASDINRRENEKDQIHLINAK